MTPKSLGVIFVCIEISNLSSWRPLDASFYPSPENDAPLAADNASTLRHHPPGRGREVMRRKLPLYGHPAFSPHLLPDGYRFGNFTCLAHDALNPSMQPAARKTGIRL
jgi:hypothetical protein